MLLWPALQLALLASRGPGRACRHRLIFRRWLRARSRLLRWLLTFPNRCLLTEEVAMRTFVTTVAELAGFGLIISGLWMLNMPVAVVTSGVLLVVVGVWQGNR